MTWATPPRARAVAVVAVAIWLAGAAPASAGRAPQPCRSSAYETVQKREGVRIVERRGRWYGCWKGARRTTRLVAPPAEVSLPTDFVLAGRYVAFRTHTESDESGGSVLFSRLVVADLSTGRRVTVADRMDEAIWSWVVTRSGSVAWTQEVLDPSQTIYQVWKRDAAGVALLDSAPDVDKFSLALAGPHLYWMRGGAPRSAELR